jgi:phosphatidylserine synthase
VNIRAVFLGLGAAAALVHVALYIMIMADLDRRGTKTNIFLARIFFGRYLKAYKDATVKETGKPGRLYSLCLTAIVLTLVFVVAAILSPKG